MNTRLVCVAVALCALLAGAPAHAVELTWSASTLVAHRGDVSLWTTKHAHLEDRGDGLIGAVDLGAVVVYAADRWAWVADSADGTIRRSVPLPGAATAVAVEGEDAVVTTRRTDGAVDRWRIGAADDDVPLVVPTGPGDHAQLRADAIAVLVDLAASHDMIAPDDDLSTLLEGIVRSGLTDDAVAALRAAAAHDSTSPWYPGMGALVLAEALRPTEARAMLLTSFNVEDDMSPALIMLGVAMTEAWPVGLDDEVAQLFQRGVGGMLARGYDPELAYRAVAVETMVGPAPSVDRPDLGASVRRALRIWDLAPFAEGAAFHYRALAAALRADGQTAVAEVWEQRAALALPTAHIDGISSDAELAGELLLASAAALAALLVSLLVRWLRYAPGTWTSGTPAWRRLAIASFTRLELIGIVGLTVACGLLYQRTQLACATLGAISAAPDAVLVGNPGHPDAAAWWAQAPDDPAARYMLGLSRLAADDLDGAQEIFASLRGARALNNLGVIAERRGDDAGAGALYRQSIDADPTLDVAAWNLGRSPSTPRIERYSLWAPEAPVAAGPDRDTYAAAWRAIAAHAPVSLRSVVGSTLGSTAVGFVLHGQAPLLLAVLALCVVGLVLPRPPVDSSPRTPMSTLGWMLGWVLPGTARQLGPIGPVVLAIFLASLALFANIQLTEGLATNPLDALLSPSFHALYVLYSPRALDIDLQVARFANLWLGILPLNLALVAAAERFVPDPIGPNLTVVRPDTQ